MTDMAQTVIDDKNVNDNKYSKNERYSQEEINKLVKIYHMADAVGDKETVKDAYSKICEYIEKYVYKTLSRIKEEYSFLYRKRDEFPCLLNT